MKKTILFLFLVIYSFIANAQNSELDLIPHSFKRGYSDAVKELNELLSSEKKNELEKEISLQKSSIKIFIKSSREVWSNNLEQKISDIKYKIKDLEFDHNFSFEERKSKEQELKNLLAEKDKEKQEKNAEYETLLSKYE